MVKTINIASRNRTVTCNDNEIHTFRDQLLNLDSYCDLPDIVNEIICQDTFEAISFLPIQSIDLLILDPPYNLSKNFHGNMFREKDSEEYAKWFEELIIKISPLLKPSASIYVCADWKTSIIIAPILQKHFILRNRITWEREKGRGSNTNWKNNTEDIWFCTSSNEYTFNVDNVKLKRKVIAPYRNKDGSPKDWEDNADGKFRMTHPSNIWSDITVPFWSMPENTNHPTQKPEKLIAKLILASTNIGDIVLDPFLGSGTSAVVAKKLKRNYIGIEMNEEYSCWAIKRLQRAETDISIQGYADGVFWERNSLADQQKREPIKNKTIQQEELFA